VRFSITHSAMVLPLTTASGDELSLVAARTSTQPLEVNRVTGLLAPSDRQRHSTSHMISQLVRVCRRHPLDCVKTCWEVRSFWQPNLRQHYYGASRAGSVEGRLNSGLSTRCEHTAVTSYFQHSEGGFSQYVWLTRRHFTC